METVFLIILTLFALYYIYKTTFKNSGCNCGSNDCPSKKGKEIE
ncbi:FeoB-associated Cys-rich membrane protein [Malaciobacter sp. WC5094]